MLFKIFFLILCCVPIGTRSDDILFLFSMPHSLLELNAMSEQQLKTIAESLDIKGWKKMDRATLGFAILDTQAVIESQKPADQEAKTRKRGRPKKADAPAP